MDARHLLKEQYCVSTEFVKTKVFHWAPWKKLSPTSLYAFKLWCHVTTLLMLSALVLLDAYSWGNYARAASSVSCHFFTPGSCDSKACAGNLNLKNPTLEDYECILSKRTETIGAIAEALEQYANIGASSLARFQFPSIPSVAESSSCSLNTQPTLTVQYLNGHRHVFPLVVVNSSSYYIPDDIARYHTTIIPSSVAGDLVAGIVMLSNRQYLRSGNNEKQQVLLYEERNRVIKTANQAVALMGVTGMEDTLTPANFSDIDFFELMLPLEDSFASDVYHATYAWEFKIRYQYRSRVDISVVNSQKVVNICGIQSVGAISGRRRTTTAAVEAKHDENNPSSSRIRAVSTAPGVGNGNDDYDDDGDDAYDDAYAYAEVAQKKGASNEYRANPMTAIYVLNIITIATCFIYLSVLCQDLAENLRFVQFVKLILSTEGRNKQEKEEEEEEEEESADSRKSISSARSRNRGNIGDDNKGNEPALVGKTLYAPAELYDLDLFKGNKNIPDDSANITATAPVANEALVDDEQRYREGTHVGIAMPAHHQKLLDSLDEHVRKEEMLARRTILPWEQLSWGTKFRLLDGWRMVSILSTALAVVCCALFLGIKSGYYYAGGSTVFQSNFVRGMLGVSTGLQWISLLSYFRYSNRFTQAALVLWGAFFKVQRVVISALPIIIGVIIFGTVMFGNTTDAYAKFRDSLVTLFAVANGDSIWDIFKSTSYGQHSDAVGSVYLVLIFLFFNLFMLRLILAVVETLYLYLCLYANAMRKRKEYRKYRLAKSGGDAPYYPAGAEVQKTSSSSSSSSTRADYSTNNINSVRRSADNGDNITTNDSSCSSRGSNSCRTTKLLASPAPAPAPIPLEPQAAWVLAQACYHGGGRKRHRSTLILKDLLRLVTDDDSAV